MPRKSRSTARIYVKGKKGSFKLISAKRLRSIKQPYQIRYPKNSLRGFIQRNFYIMTMKQMAKARHKSLWQVKNAVYEMREMSAIPTKQQIVSEYFESLRGEKRTPELLAATLGLKTVAHARMLAKIRGIIYPRKKRDSRMEGLKNFIQQNWKKIKADRLTGKQIVSMLGIQMVESMVSKAVKDLKKNKLID